MLEQSRDLTTTVIAGIGGTGALVLLGKWVLRQVLEAKGELTQSGLINTLREDIDRLRENERRMESRIEAMETKLSDLVGRLVVVRGHAMFAHQVATSYDPITGEQRKHVIDTLTMIIKDE